MVMEVLNGLLNRAHELQLISSVSLGQRERIDVSHLFFADDTLTFCQPDLRNLLHLRCVFMCFQAVFGLKINLHKSELVVMSLLIPMS